MRPIWSVALLLSLAASLCCEAAETATVAGPDSVIQTTLRLRLRQTEADVIVTGWGSAVAIDLSAYGLASRRYLLSARHLVIQKNGKGLAPGELALEVNSAWTGVRVVAVDDKADLCLLECEKDLPALARLGKGDDDVGDQLWVIGCPRGVAPCVSYGRLTSKTPNVEGRLWEAAAKFWHGNSGGAVFNARTGTIAGVAVAGVKAHRGDDMDGKTALFAPVDTLNRFLTNFARLQN